MTEISKSHPANMIEALEAKGPATDRAEKMMLYGRFVGSWDLKIIDYDTDLGVETPGEWHFGWALDGRAVQDVLIAPVERLRRSNGQVVERGAQRYGSSMRIYSPKGDLWRVTWFSPIRGIENHLVGKQAGRDIVQTMQGTKKRIEEWLFTEITENSFHWIGRESGDKGKTWRTAAEFFARRRVQ